jgi:hypothetical protein
MNLAAKIKGGECLSTTYPPNGTRLKWQCAKGHEWNSAPNNIKNMGQ